jgi:hypothetical protein
MSFSSTDKATHGAKGKNGFTSEIELRQTKTYRITPEE